MDNILKKKKISIACCCYNEEGNLEDTYSSFVKEIDKFPKYDFEIVFEDNCSTDRTRHILRDIANKDKRVKVIFNLCNFGVQKSSVNLALNCSGDAIISFPCDLQEPIELMSEYIRYWEEGYHVVWGQKIASEENKIKFFFRSMYYSILDLFAEKKQLHQVTSYGLMDKTVVDAFLFSAKQDPSINIRQWITNYEFKIKLIPYVQRARRWGKSSYNMFSYYDFAITSLCNTTIKPLRCMSVIGAVTASICIIISIIYLIYKLMHWNSFDVGIAPLIIGIFFGMGVQLFCLGLIGEYIGVILRRITNSILVLEEERINFEDVK